MSSLVVTQRRLLIHGVASTIVPKALKQHRPHSVSVAMFSLMFAHVGQGQPDRPVVLSPSSVLIVRARSKNILLCHGWVFSRVRRVTGGNCYNAQRRKLLAQETEKGSYRQSHGSQ